MKHIHFHLKTVTPVVIGDGDQTGLSPFVDYVFHDGQVHYLDHALINRHLADRPEAMETWLQAAHQGRTGRFDLYAFMCDELGDDPAYWSTHSLPYAGLPRDTFISTVVKTAGRPYFPGSSLKGAFKTALFWGWLTEDAEGKAMMVKILRAVRKKEHRLVTRLIGQAERTLFGDMRERRPRAPMDANLLRMGDATPFGREALAVVPKVSFHLLKDAPILTPSEAVPPGEETGFRLALPGCFRNPYLQGFKEGKDFLDLFARYVECFVNWELDALEDFPEMDDIYSFYNHHLKQDKTYLRLGHGKGWLLNSVGLAVHATDQDAVEPLGRLLRVGKRGPFLRTRSVVLKDGLPYDPLGWVELEVER